MPIVRITPTWAAGTAALIVIVLAAGCQTPEPKPEPAQPVAQPSPEPAPAPAPPPPPTAQERQQAQKLALEGLDQLQNGNEGGASATLDKALKLDPDNELARKLRDQIGADAQRELGSTFFRYTVKPGDTLARLADVYLKDRYRFYILAKYNDIANPNKVAVGQVIRIPGREPAAAPAAAASRSKPAPEPRPVAAPGTAPPPATEPAATPAPAAAAATAPAPAPDAKKRELVTRYTREAKAAEARQDLKTAIARWDDVLKIEPENELARLSRARAIDLQQRIDSFDKGK
jgi:Tfp pilus assembly protein PilF